MLDPPLVEDDAVLVSALEHYSYCPRQCALIHREQTYDENIYTLRGTAVHERVDRPDVSVDGDMQVETGLAIWSDSLGLTGKADVVEFHGVTPYPVEYKHGPSRRGQHADLQVCAQAMCLEEMLDLPVPKGAVYHFSSRKRREVVFTATLRERVKDAIEDTRRILRADTLPTPPADARCKNCSLIDSCLPYAVAGKSKLSTLNRHLFIPLSPETVSDGQ